MEVQSHLCSLQGSCNLSVTLSASLSSLHLMVWPSGTTCSCLELAGSLVYRPLHPFYLPDSPLHSSLPITRFFQFLLVRMSHARPHYLQKHLLSLQHPLGALCSVPNSPGFPLVWSSLHSRLITSVSLTVAGIPGDQGLPFHQCLSRT